ncbi:MAG: type II secretion system F family protein [Endozoicomonas sp.]
MVAQWIIGVLVFLAVLFLLLALTARRQDKDIQRRLQRRVGKQAAKAAVRGMVRSKYQRELSPWEQRLEALPLMGKLGLWLEQSGRQLPAYRLLLLGIGLGVLAGTLVMLATGMIIPALLATGAGLSAPVLKTVYDRHRRLVQVEEQLPDALDSMNNALRAGHPFTESLKMLGEDFRAPLGPELARTYADINYGNDVRRALMALVQRVPSASLRMLVVTILVQRQSGGNLTEVLGRISFLVRQRFQFQRRLKTLSAATRAGANVLIALPFVMFAFLSFTNPELASVLTETETGHKMLGLALGLILVAIVWIRMLLRVRV